MKVRKRPTLKQILYHPLTWLAVGAHIALLFVPFNPNKPAPIEDVPEEEIDESIPVDILNLSDISTPTPPPEDTPQPPESSPPPQAAPPPAVPAPNPVPAAAETPPVDIPVEEAPVAETPAEQLPAEAPAEEPAPQPAYDPSGDQQVFISNLGNLRGVNAYDAVLLPNPEDFPNGNAALFLDYSSSTPAPVAGALNATRIDKQPSDALQVVSSSYSAAGYTVAQLPNYADEELHELKNAQGESVLFMSLVNLNGSTLVVTWASSPM